MTISNEGSGDDGRLGALVRLQSEYQARLTEETMRYLRSLQTAFSPKPPGTVVQATGERLIASGSPGGSVSLDVEIENRQRAHIPVSPSVTPLVSDHGVTWYPVTELDPVALMISPDEKRSLSVTLRLPDELPVGLFRGSLLLQGFLAEGVPVEITVKKAAVTRAPRKRSAAQS